MFKEYDVVLSTRQIKNIPTGTLGTVLIAYEDGVHYEVEFVDEELNSIDVLTVHESDIKKKK